MTIDDYRLELTTLQKRDTELALSNGIKNKDDWCKFMINNDHDEVAEGIIDLAKRYELDQNVVAMTFDPTMIIRLAKVSSKQKEITM